MSSNETNFNNVEGTRNSSKSSLAGRALAIVLQHLMMPNLGWYTDALDKRLVEVNQEIVALGDIKEYARTVVDDRLVDLQDDSGADQELDEDDILVRDLQKAAKYLSFSAESLLPAQFAIQVAFTNQLKFIPILTFLCCF